MPHHSFRRLDLLLLVAIILIGVFFRFYRLDSLPPGDNVDSVEYGLDALRILQGEHAVFFPTNRGRESLFSYIVAALFLALEPGTLAVYAASALVGVLTLPVVYLAGREIFSSEGPTLQRWGSLIAALMVALSYWHLNWSRFGVRAILVPLVTALTVLLLYHGLRTGRPWAFLGSGLALGLSAYTYQSARALPLLILLVFASAYTVYHSYLKATLRDTVLVLGVAALAVVPLGLYALTHPDIFNQRTDETLVFNTAPDLAGKLAAFGRLTFDFLLMFSVRGDDRFLNHIPGRPALNLFLSVAFLVGIVVSLWRVRRPAYALLLAWLVVMSTPALLAIRGSHEKRAIGALPAVALLIAVGTLVPWETLRRRITLTSPGWAKAMPPLFLVLVGAGFLYTAVDTYRDYFIIWGSDPDLFTHFEAGPSAIGRAIRDLPRNQQVYLSPIPADHPNIQVNSSGRKDVASYNGRVCLVFPTRTLQPTTYIIVPSDDKTSLKLLAQAFPGGAVVREGPLHYQQPYFLAYSVPAGEIAQYYPATPRRAIWGDHIELIGYDLDKTAPAAGDKLTLALGLRGLAPIDTRYTLFVHLLGPPNPASGTPLWAQADSEPCSQFYPTTAWAPGEIIRDQVTLAIPATTPPGDYRLALGFYNVETMERLPVRDRGQAGPGDHIVLGQVVVSGKK